MERTEHSIISSLNHSDPTISYTFTRIKEAAIPYWKEQKGREEVFLAVGNKRAWWDKRWITVYLGYNPPDGRICLQARIADSVFRPPERFYDLIFQSTIEYEKSFSRYDPENFVVMVESDGTCPHYIERIPEVVDSLFSDFARLTSDALLYEVLQKANALLLGAPTDLFQTEETVENHIIKRKEQNYAISR
jgi:hypothetical protein